MFCNVNVLAVLVASVVGMIIGSIWYSPKVLGKQYMTLLGLGTDCMMPDGTTKKAMTIVYIKQFVLIIITNFVLGRMIFMVGSATALQGAVLALWLWVGFVGAIAFGSALWDKKVKLAAITSGCMLVTLVISGMIIAAWR